SIKKINSTGTANYCNKRTTPVKAEEGLTGRLSNESDTAVGCYGDTSSYSSDVHEALDAEGRCIITLHKIRLPTTSEVKDLAIINVYVPRAGDREDRLLYKLKFLSVLQSRCEALLQNKIHVIVLGDLNLTHKNIDNCEPETDVNCSTLPCKIWMNEMLQKSERDSSLPRSDGYLHETSLPGLKGGHFSDIFRFLNPNQENAYTNWCTTTDHRKTNYGRRLDYILVDTELAQFATECKIMTDVEGSDHCPVILTLNCESIPSPTCPQHCSKFMPEFKGQQQKLSSFFLKAEKKVKKTSELDSSPDDVLLSSLKTAIKRDASAADKSNSKKIKIDSNKMDGRQVSLTSFFTKSSSRTSYAETFSSQKSLSGSSSSQESSTALEGQNSQNSEASETNSSKNNSQAWKSLLKGPAPPPLCPGHKEPCVLKTVNKKGPNKNKQFYVCCRPDGAPGNPEFRCNFFRWLDDRHKKKT
ncbi:unnamed protein product, partial [Lymnaea stagnalis]